MEDKLTIEQVLSYAPYGLTGLWINGKNRIYKVTNVCVCGDGNISFGRSLKTRYKHELHRPLSEFTPLLLPLSELKNWDEVFFAGMDNACPPLPKYVSLGLEYHDNAVECIVDFSDNQRASISYSFDEKMFESNGVRFNQLAAFNKLFELHADVNHLIEKGLALDKTKALGKEATNDNHL